MLIGDCNTEEVVTAMKKNMMKDVLEQFGQSIDEWNTEKMPSAESKQKRLIEQMKKLNEARRKIGLQGHYFIKKEVSH